MENIACNLIYNNGGEGDLVGFAGRCTIDNIKFNVEKGSGRWCSQPQNPCRKYYNRGFKGSSDSGPCNESRLFITNIWNPGNNFETGEPFRVTRTAPGRMAILTTRFGDAPESERKIIGFLRIKKVIEDGHRLVGSRRETLRLPLDEAKELNFWAYHRNVNSSQPVWKQGRFRYLSDESTAAILHDLRDTVQDKSSAAMITSILEAEFPKYKQARPLVSGAINADTVKRILLKRKYGRGGESEAHKRLKNYIARNPRLIGLHASSLPSIEHPFISGDLVDILFTSKAGDGCAVVEIELDNVLPGVHQAIKY